MGLCSIIILTCNALEYTRLCLQSLYRHTAYPYELIMVDNGSTDGTLTFLSHQAGPGVSAAYHGAASNATRHEVSAFSTRNADICHNAVAHQKLQMPRRVLVLKNTQNLGFARGCNQGVSAARGDSLLFLNNDTILTPRWLENLHYCLNSHPAIAAVNPCSNFNPYAQVNLPGDRLEQLESFAASFNRSNPAKWQATTAASGFCLLVKQTFFQQVGGFDEQFQIGCYEDNDLVLRMQQAGYQIRIAWDTFVYHFGNRSFRINGLDLDRIMHENSQRYQAKHPEV